jgi:serine/threonine protein kinase
LAHLHEQGLVHRDIKPSNVIFVNGVPKLSDIGVVTDAGDTQSIVGTEGYLPPEGPGTPQADIYSLGQGALRNQHWHGSAPIAETSARSAPLARCAAHPGAERDCGEGMRFERTRTIPQRGSDAD